MAKTRSEDVESRGKQRLEAVASIAGAVLALGTLGVILWDGVRADRKPPFVTVAAVGTERAGEGFVVEVEAFNSGDRTAAQVMVKGEVRRGDQIVATSEATFDYVPGHARRRGGLLFKDDPQGGDLLLRALGYVDP